MNFTKGIISKKILPSILPIIVFIIADEIFGTIIGLIIALVFGLIEFIITYLYLKKRDKFLLLDIFLLVIFGSISLLLENELFFKIKPAIIQLIFCALLGFSAFSSKNLITLMSKKYLGDIELKSEQQIKIKKTLKVLFFIFLLHSFLILYSAYFMSKESWAFISSVLFYILLGAYFLFEFIKTRFIGKKH